MADSPLKLWGGRFLTGTNPIVDAYTSSLAVDRRIAHGGRARLDRPRAHAGAQGIIPAGTPRRYSPACCRSARRSSRGSFELDEAWKTCT